MTPREAALKLAAFIERMPREKVRECALEIEQAVTAAVEEAMEAYTQERAKVRSLRAALEAYPEWIDDDDPQAVGTMQRFVTCLVCGGGGAFNGDGKPSKRLPPTHKPTCKRMLALNNCS